MIRVFSTARVGSHASLSPAVPVRPWVKRQNRFMSYSAIPPSRQSLVSMSGPPCRARVFYRQASTSTSTSTSSGVAADVRSLVSRLKNALFGTSVALFLAFGYFYVTDTRAGVHRWLSVPSLRWIYADAEDAHEAGTSALRAMYDLGLHPRERPHTEHVRDSSVDVFGHTLSNQMGTSAGIDKCAEIPDALLALGPAVVEVGGATPLPQGGNPRPRVFRVPSQKAMINRYGLNSQGAEAMAARLRQRVREFAYAIGLGADDEAVRMVLDGEAGVPPGSLTLGKLMAVQVAKNSQTPDQDIEAVKRDYVFCVDRLAPYADIIVVNVSSPNTPGLRDLQRAEPLTQILSGVVEAAKATRRRTKPAVMVKVSPDEDSDEQVRGVCEAVRKANVDGVIVGNTTKRRPDRSPTGYALAADEALAMSESGGYSGPQLFEGTLALVKKYRSTLDSAQVTHEQEAHQPTIIFASGGITTGAQAREVLQAGASVAMIYTALVYGGVGTITRIKQEMRDLALVQSADRPREHGD